MVAAIIEEIIHYLVEEFACNMEIIELCNFPSTKLYQNMYKTAVSTVLFFVIIYSWEYLAVSMLNSTIGSFFINNT